MQFINPSSLIEPYNMKPIPEEVVYYHAFCMPTGKVIPLSPYSRSETIEEAMSKYTVVLTKIPPGLRNKPNYLIKATTTYEVISE